MQIIYCSLACELETNEDQSAKNNTGSQIRSCLLLLNGEESRFPTVAPWPASTAWLAARCEGHRTSTERRACAFRLPGPQSHHAHQTNGQDCAPLDLIIKAGGGRAWHTGSALLREMGRP